MQYVHGRLWVGVFISSAGLWLAGCACPKQSFSNVCLLNQQRGLAVIQCQPVDVEVLQGETAVFAVDAKGKDLTYQWYFRGESGIADVVGSGTTGGQSAQLTVLGVDPPKGGHYWVEIDSTGLWGAPARTRSRDAHLGIRADVSGAGSGGVQVYPPQQASMGAGSSGSTACGPHCGWLNYQNGGAAFDPEPGLTKCQAKVRVGTAYRNNTTFHLKWIESTGVNNCAVNTTGSTTQKEHPVDPSKLYVYTVYFKAPCPAPGSQVYLELEYVP